MKDRAWRPSTSRAPRDHHRPHSRLRWRTIPLTLGLLLVLGAIVALSLWWERRVSVYSDVARTLPAELAAAQREGLPLNPWELRDNPPAPARQNAAPLYGRILRTVPPGSKPDDEGTISDFLKPGRAHVGPAKVRAALARNATVLALAERAARMPRCDFQRQYELGPNLLLPEYAGMRRIARMLAARALLKSESGDVRGAFRDIEAGAHVGRHAGGEPIIIAALVQIAIDAIMDRAFRAILLAHKADPRALRAAAGAQSTFGPPPDIARALRSELVMDRVTVGMVASDPKTLRDYGLAGSSLPVYFAAQSTRSRMVMADAWEARMINYWRRVSAAMRRYKSDPVGTYRTVESLGWKEEGHEREPTYELSAILTPVFSQAVLKAMGCEEYGRLRLALLELVAYRQKAGKWPDSLAELPEPPPPDIFTGRPPIYRRTPDGFVLYSVGENFRDDGGKAKADRKGDPPPDIVVQYPMQL